MDEGGEGQFGELGFEGVLPQQSHKRGSCKHQLGLSGGGVLQNSAEGAVTHLHHIIAEKLLQLFDQLRGQGRCLLFLLLLGLFLLRLHQQRIVIIFYANICGFLMELLGS